ncbi:glycinin G4-like [Vigna umbellata]|uniref:glycinin G4-like n=1 Tax=Vigna umbellata TaxID=87088 RepID=UPI001F5F07BE|nr:glycinin G4-like [Vigna umbellata]
MARPFTLSLLSLCLLLSAWSCFGGSSSTNRFNICQLNSLNALKPDHRVETDGGLVETWSSKHPELECAGVTVTRRTLYRNGFQMPSYSPYSQMIMAIQGKGALGLALSGCAETYEEPAKESSSSSQKPSDSHQKIRQFDQGHVMLIPRGVPFWIFNTGDEPLITVTLLDTSSDDNQLDQSPREFYLAGNPDIEHPEAMKEKQQQQAEEEGGNVLSGFGKRFLARALNIDQDIANKLISPDDEMKQIVKLKEGLSVISPKWQGQQEDEDEDDDDEDEDESVSRPSRRPSHGKRVHKKEETVVEPYPHGKHVHKEVEKEVEPLPPRKHVHKEEEKEIEPLPPRRSRHHDEGDDGGEEEKPRARRTRGPTPSPKGEGHRGVEEEDESEDREGHKTRHEKTRHEKSWKEHRPEGDVEKGEAHEEWETTPSKDKPHGSNGLDETICSSKLQFNIAHPKGADFYNPKAGRIKNLNSQSLPALQHFGLSAQYVVLYKNGIYSPHWNMDANSVIYVIRGQGQVRVVNNEGIVMFDDELKKGQLLVVPQNFMVAEEAGDQGFEYVVFKTNDNAVTSYLKETFRAFPAEVLANIYKLKHSQVHDLKYNGNLGPLVNPENSLDQSS